MTDAGWAVSDARLNPFRLGVGPEDAIRHRAWRDVGETALARLLAGPCVVVLMGEPGTGKTLLLADLQRRLHALGHAAEYGAPGDLPDQHDAPGPRFVLIDHARFDAGERTAMPLGDDVRCVLAGLPATGETFAYLPYPPTMVRLGPLPPGEARAFVAERLAQSGRPADLLSQDAIALLVTGTGGVPRFLCSIGGGALQLATTEGAPQVTYEHVAEALEIAGLSGSPSDPALAPERSPLLPRAGIAGPKRSSGRAAVLAGLVALAALFGVVTVIRSTRDRSAVPVTDSDDSTLAAAPAAPAVPVTAQPAPPSAAPPSVPVVTQADAATTPGAAPAGNPPAGPAAGAAAPQPAAMAAEMPPTPTHLVVSFRLGDRAAEQQGDILAQHLREAGYIVGDPVPEIRLTGKPGLHAFFAEDIAAARRLQGELGPSAPQALLAALPPRSSLPRPGTLEITVPANAPVDEWTQALDQAALASGADPAPAARPRPATAPILPSQPADGASVAPGPARTATLSWTDPELPAPHGAGQYFVEVRTLDGGTAHEVFAEYTDQPAVSIALDPDSHQYAWRVYVVTGADGHYDSSPWFRFTVAANVAQK